jgi:inner membrane protein
MISPLTSKLITLAGIVIVLLVALTAVEGVVHERQRYQAEATQGVAGSLAGAQTLVGPALQRRCLETWSRKEGEGKTLKTIAEQRAFVQTQWPQSLQVQQQVAIEPRYRGLFKVNTFQAQGQLLARWAEGPLALPPTQSGQPDAKVVCEPLALAVSLSDARGVRAAEIKVDGQALPVLANGLAGPNNRGFHAQMPLGTEQHMGVQAQIKLTLAGTRSLALVPVADETTVQWRSDWPHPSFAGQFLPITRKTSAQGFEAQWQVSALATSAQQALADGAQVCELRDAGDAAYPTHPDPKQRCVDSFGSHFIDPVYPYVLSDRALKYGSLFVLLTFVGVGMVELMRRVRVHPMQYLLVGAALTVFFLLLISLSEHMAFGPAYAVSATACTALLAFYGRFALQGVRAGLGLGAAVAALYGALFGLLQMEQAALVMGALLVFGVLAAVMVLTRRLDWYGLSAQGGGGQAGNVADAPALPGAAQSAGDTVNRN